MKRGKRNLDVQVCYVSLQPTICCQICGRSRLRLKWTCLPQRSTAPSRVSEKTLPGGWGALAMDCADPKRPVCYGTVGERTNLPTWRFPG